MGRESVTYLIVTGCDQRNASMANEVSRVAWAHLRSMAVDIVCDRLDSAQILSNSNKFGSVPVSYAKDYKGTSMQQDVSMKRPLFIRREK